MFLSHAFVLAGHDKESNVLLYECNSIGEPVSGPVSLPCLGALVT